MIYLLIFGCMGFAVHGLLIVVASLEQHGLCCFVGCGIFLDQGLNLCPLHWQAYS